ncbi:MAG TPA: hypothetical protein VHZ54_10540 [Solirubrobacterales bacterium]|jgi:hypothetical protein|nr:hypothetical protein [Solirubrobacterales bacterium]
MAQVCSAAAPPAWSAHAAGEPGTAPEVCEVICLLLPSRGRSRVATAVAVERGQLAL